jgi:hypothetical protein
VLDPRRAPTLAGWSILVELHDFIDPTISQTLIERFTPTHEIEILEGQTRVPGELPELAFMTAREQEAVLSERRPGSMRWAFMRPRGTVA